MKNLWFANQFVKSEKAATFPNDFADSDIKDGGKKRSNGKMHFITSDSFLRVWGERASVSDVEKLLETPRFSRSSRFKQYFLMLR